MRPWAQMIGQLAEYVRVVYDRVSTAIMSEDELEGAILINLRNGLTERGFDSRGLSEEELLGMTASDLIGFPCIDREFAECYEDACAAIKGSREEKVEGIADGPQG